MDKKELKEIAKEMLGEVDKRIDGIVSMAQIKIRRKENAEVWNGKVKPIKW